MSRQDDIRKQITNHNRRLQILKNKYATMGINTPPEDLMAIEDIEAKIKELAGELNNIKDEIDLSPPDLPASILGQAREQTEAMATDTAVISKSQEVVGDASTEKTGHETKFVNRKGEFELFKQILEGKIEKNILCFKADSEMGKSLLLDEFFSHCESSDIPCILTDFKEVAFEKILVDFFRKIYDIMRPHSELTDFLKHINFTYVEYLKANNSKKEGWIKEEFKWYQEKAEVTPLSQKILAILRFHKDGDHYPGWLAEALINDLSKHPKQLVMMFDTFNNPEDIPEKWLVDWILTKAPSIDRVVIIIAGQKKPKKNRDWAKYYESQELGGIMDAKEWQEVYPDIPIDHIELSCVLTNGKPKEMVSVLKKISK